MGLCASFAMQVMPGWGLHAERTLRFERLSLRACEAVGWVCWRLGKLPTAMGKFVGKKKLMWLMRSLRGLWEAYERHVGAVWEAYGRLTEGLWVMEGLPTLSPKN